MTYASDAVPDILAETVNMPATKTRCFSASARKDATTDFTKIANL